MRKLVLPLIAFAVTAPALADFADVIRSWRTPPQRSYYGTCRGLAWDGAYIWCSVFYTWSPNMVYRCRPSNGRVVASFPSGFTSYVAGAGMCYRRWDRQRCIEFAVRDGVARKSYIYRYNFNGSVINRKRIFLPNYLTGIMFDGKNEWVVEPREPRSVTYKLNAGGFPLSSFVVKGPGLVYGLDKQADFFWFSLGYIGTHFYGACKTRANGSVVASFQTYGKPEDCAYENNRLWVAVQSTVFCYDVSNAPAVLPASVGRIKVLFN
jgi:hypothetical protein